MKKTLTVILGTITLLFCLVCLGAAQSINKQADVFRLEVSSSKQVYQLGEPVELTFRLVNISAQPATYIGCFNVGGGAFEAFISEGRDNFLKLNANWGYLDIICASKLLKTGDNLETPVTILWNYKPVESNNIAPDVYKRFKEVNIWNDFAFHNAGIHYLKVREGSLESEPIKITIAQPVGEDLEVWNKIKDSSGFAYFIQYADIALPDFKTKDRPEFQKQVEDIIKEYPKSFLVKLLRQSLDKLKTREAIVRER